MDRRLHDTVRPHLAENLQGTGMADPLIWYSTSTCIDWRMYSTAQYALPSMVQPRVQFNTAQYCTIHDRYCYCTLRQLASSPSASPLHFPSAMLITMEGARNLVLMIPVQYTPLSDPVGGACRFPRPHPNGLLVAGQTANCTASRLLPPRFCHR